MHLERLEPLTGCGILGALKCVAGMPGVLPMIHGPVSCSSGHRLAMLYAGVEPLLPTTCVEQTQVVMGANERLADALKKAWEIYHPELLFVILTCATAMTGEDAAAPLREYERYTGKSALLFDGSALDGDEVDACARVYALFQEKFALDGGGKDALALDGLALTDYAFEKNYAALEALFATAMDARFVRGLFAGSDLLTGGDEYRRARKIPTGLLWDRASLDSAAPIGVAGSWRYLRYVSAAAGLPLKPAAAAERDAWAAKLRPYAEALRGADVRVGVEGAGWYAYALADFLKNELGVRVCMSVDRAAGGVEWQRVCDEFHEDLGRFELVERFRDFGAKLVFGSSNVQLDEAWRYVPFYQPVWRVVEPVETLGYAAAAALARLLAEEVLS